ncbi:MAG: efflux RND transporter permease subunit [Candidatus Omnitrophica bacterium]|nr:efflux RND transporter permease subunit [Candidatus Omnitrophota bacterium]
MSLPSFSVRRPVTVTMIFLGVILLGVISWLRLPQELFPPITYPQLTVVTNYPNTAPEEVESLITKVIEEAVGTVKNTRSIMSTSREGTSLVIVEFNWGADMNFAALGMREKIDLVKERLPRDAEEPIVMKFNPFAKPIMTLSISGDRPLDELYEISKRYVKDRIEKVEGVASCSISGGIKREIHVDINGGLLYNSDIDLMSIVTSLRDSNLNYPAGATKEKFFEWLIRTMGEFQTVSDIDSTVIALDEPADNRRGGTQEERYIKGKRLIKLSDVSEVTDGFKERTSYSRYNGKENVSVSVQKQAEANTIKTVQNALVELKKIREILPDKVFVDLTYDQSKFIRNAINGVTSSALQGGVLAVIVLFFFLKSVKHSAIVAFSIPISIMVTFSLMYFSNISINIISFGGLALGIGMLVDNAIVVMENIFRHRHLGKDSNMSAIEGTEEVNAAITSSTLTTVAVFLPLAFVVGIAGQIFKDLAFTITFSVLASLFVALSLIPRLSIMGKEKSAGRPVRGGNDDEVDTGILSRIYVSILKVFLSHKLIGMSLVLILFLGSFKLFGYIGKEFMPKVDEGQFMIKVDMSPGTKLDITDRVSKRIEDAISDMPGTLNVSATIGSNKDESTASGSVEMLKENQAQIVVNLAKERELSTDEFIQRLNENLKTVDMEDADIKFILSQSLMSSAFQGSGGAPIVIEVKGQDLDVLNDLSRKIMKDISVIEGIYDVKSNVEDPAPETKVVVNKNKAALYNLSVRDIARTVQIAIDGWVATKFKEEGNEIDVRVRLREEDRDDFSIIKQLRIISPDGIKVPLKEVADFKLGKGPSEIKRKDKKRTILVFANVFGRDMNAVMNDVSSFLEKMELPSGYSQPILTGEREQMNESFKSLQFALILSILVIYMIMAAQFESLWQPFIIMFTVPLSIIGILAVLFLTKTTLNVVALLGVIVLGGIVVNNAIVLIDYINSLVRSGKGLYDSVIEASKTRLRPILMTTLTTVLGLLPLALGIGEGGELISPLAITVMGGLLASTFLTLVVIPTAYLVAARMIIRPGKSTQEHKSTKT